MRVSDLPAVTALHTAALPGGFFVRLGPRFLSRYLATYLASPHAVALVYDWNGAAAGFVVGATAPREHPAWVVRRQGARLAVCGLLALVARPRLWATFVRRRFLLYLAKLRRLARRRSSATALAIAARQVERSVPAARLAHVAVVGWCRGYGAGRELVAGFVDEAASRGVDRVTLLTAVDSNADGFYLRLGWRLAETLTDRDGRKVLVFEWPN